MVSRTNYDEVVDAKLTAKGRAYLSQNPHLWNPVNWTKVAAIAACIAYDGDVDALRLVADYWGRETAKNIKRFSAFYSIESLMSDNLR